MRDSPIILIGPMAVGKTSVALSLSEKLGRPNVPMDRIRWYYYLKAGYSIAREKELNHNFLELQTYWKTFNVETIAAGLRDFSDCIMDFGGGHSYYPDPERLALMEKTLEPYPHIFLLLPSEDRDESLRVCVQRLKERYGDKFDEADLEATRNYIWHESNARLAKTTIYTAEKTVEDVAHEIIRQVTVTV
jgi:shikimate kinase